MDDYVDIDTLGIIFLLCGGAMLGLVVMIAIVWGRRPPPLYDPSPPKQQGRVDILDEQED